MSESNAVLKEFALPEDFAGTSISSYLEGRSYDGFKVKQIIKAVSPIIDRFNANAECLEDLVTFSVGMSAKYQTLNAKIESYEQDIEVNKFNDVIGKIECAISDLLEEEIIFEDKSGYALADID